MAIPKVKELLNPLLTAFHQLGGSANIQEMEDEVAKNLKLTDKDVNELHRGSRTKLNYRLAWTRNYLKRYGLFENSAMGVWALTPLGRKTKIVDVKELLKFLNSQKREKSSVDDPINVGGDTEDWKVELLEILQNISTSAFERLCKRLLRESGFTQVKVTGKSGDGGIDGVGVLKVGGMISFPVVFQCKRYKGKVGSSKVRDLRGAMAGRADKGLLITTGTFTKDARDEARRDGTFLIDLIDGNDLMEKLKSLSLGIDVKEERIEKIEIIKNWFDGL